MVYLHTSHRVWNQNRSWCHTTLKIKVPFSESLRFSKESLQSLGSSDSGKASLHKWFSKGTSEGSPVTLILTEKFKTWLISVSRKLDHLRCFADAKTNTMKWTLVNSCIENWGTFFRFAYEILEFGFPLWHLYLLICMRIVSVTPTWSSVNELHATIWCIRISSRSCCIEREDVPDSVIRRCSNVSLQKRNSGRT